MNRLRKMVLSLLGVGVFVCLWHSPAEATRSFTIAQTPASVEYPMGAAQPITLRVTNNSTAGETITTVRFNLANNTYTTLPNPETFVQPTGWNCVRTSNTRITCTATSSTYYITPANFKDFIFNINSAALSTDSTDKLSSANARFLGSNTWRTPNSTTSSWTWKSLLMTLVPAPASVGTGCQFTLTMTVTNKSTANGLVVAAVPSPRPTATTTGGAAVNNPSPVPASVTLNAGASGNIVWTYTLTGPTGGTVKFTACASTGGSCTTVSGTSRTSSSVTSTTETIAAGLSCNLTAAITNNPACLFSGSNATFVMTVTNTTGAAVANVVPSALTPIVTGAAAIGPFTGPAPVSIANIANGGNGTFTWTAPVTGNPNDQYSVSGYAIANGPIQTAAATSPIQDVDGYSVTVTQTNANSNNAELDWHIINYGCSNINQVAIAVPGTWPAASDPYSLVNNTAGSQVDSWTWNPVVTTFTSPNATDRIPMTPPNSGDFYLVFSPTPAAGTYTFNVTITDDTLPVPFIITIPTTVTVNAFDPSSGGPNEAGTAIWHEDVH